MSATLAAPVKSSGSDLNWLVGTWTSTIGDGATAATLGVGGKVWLALFINHDAQTDEEKFATWSWSQSSTTGITTISVYCNKAVTNGTYMVAYR